MTVSGFDHYSLTEFMSRSLVASGGVWSDDSLRSLATQQIPAEIFGPHRWLLEADVRITWVNWFVESLLDLTAYVRDERLEYAQLYASVRSELRSRHRSAPDDELNRTAAKIADFAWSDVAARRTSGRRNIPRAIREELWYAAEPDPRCYLCGYLFDDYARDKYLGRTPLRVVRPPLLVDLTRPRGLTLRGVQIEVDHVIPVAAGGESELSNLRLACGWCNSVKSNRLSIYESSSTPKFEIMTPDLGRVSIPHPLWILRIVATRARCEHESGCDARLETHELFVAPLNRRGALNPANAYVCCRGHDPWATTRLVGTEVLGRKYRYA
jgi:hypothetical protein